MAVPTLEPPHGTPPPSVKVAIIGGGPGGLAVAIELAKLPFVHWALYEKKAKISETGGGISLQLHTWRMLELMGAARNIAPGDYFRPSDGHTVQHRYVLDLHTKRSQPKPTLRHLETREQANYLQKELPQKTHRQIKLAAAWFARNSSRRF